MEIAGRVGRQHPPRTGDLRVSQFEDHSMPIRVLFADDQIPSESDADNKRARDEIVRELSSRIPDVQRAYEADHRWFEGLLQHLSVRQGMEIIRVKTIAQAEARLKQRDTFDVAVIDLSWTGDPSLSSDQKANAGLKLLQSLSEENKRTHDYKPTIAFSQNFKSDFELVALVLEKGALPIQKDYSELGYRTLGGAIKLLASVATPLKAKMRDVEGPVSNVGGLTLAQLLTSLTIPQLWAGVTAIVSALAALPP
jgi:hypothetical protein